MPTSGAKQALVAVGSATCHEQLEALLRKSPVSPREGKLMQFSTVAAGLDMNHPLTCLGQALLAPPSIRPVPLSMVSDNVSYMVLWVSRPPNHLQGMPALSNGIIAACSGKGEYETCFRNDCKAKEWSWRAATGWMWLSKCEASYKQGGFSEKQICGDLGWDQYLSSVRAAQSCSEVSPGC